VLLPVAVAVVTVAGTLAAARGQPAARPLDALGVALLLAGPLALAVRRAYPATTLAVAVLAVGGYLAAGYPWGPVFLASIAALCSAVVNGHRVGAYGVGGTAFVLLLVLHLVRTPDAGLPLVGAAAWLSFLVAVVAAAEWWRARRERVAQARATEHEVARRQVSEERLRIARELHDAVGHHVSLINVQAGVALYLLDRDVEQARSALAMIASSSKALLADMRATLGVLRGVDEEPPRAPVAGLARLDDLVAENLAAGLAVAVQVRGARRPLPAAVDLAAYRIVQEALTNTRRHSGAARAQVVVTYADDGLSVEVCDDGTGPPPRAAEGNGLPGMRERAAVLGGTMVAGPGEGGGFRVAAHLPIPPTQDTDDGP
jgi:signal transduction histidine kinase